MDYATFFKRFGGSTRTKHLKPAADAPGARPRDNRRPFIIPETAELPKDFIRLCPWEAEYLFTISRRAKLGIVETGRFNGGSCFLMACAAPGVPIYSVDIAPQNDDQLREFFADTGVGSSVELIVGDSQNGRFPHVRPVDLLFIDADHTYEGCMADIVNWYDKVVDGGHILFHDSYLGSWGVQDAIVDFMATHPELMIVQSPFIGACHWFYPAGSIAHLIKRR